MSGRVFEITDKSQIDKAIKFVLSCFRASEKKYYSRTELVQAEENLKEFDVFMPGILSGLVDTGRVKVFVDVSKSAILAVSAVEKESGRVLFLCGKDNLALKRLIEKMVEIREDVPDSRLVTLCFVGQAELFLKLGFTKIQSTVFTNHGVKFIAMQYNYIQIDSER